MSASVGNHIHFYNRIFVRACVFFFFGNLTFATIFPNVLRAQGFHPELTASPTILVSNGQVDNLRSGIVTAHINPIAEALRQATVPGDVIGILPDRYPGFRIGAQNRWLSDNGYQDEFLESILIIGLGTSPSDVVIERGSSDNTIFVEQKRGVSRYITFSNFTVELSTKSGIGFGDEPDKAHESFRIIGVDFDASQGGRWGISTYGMINPVFRDNFFDASYPGTGEHNIYMRGPHAGRDYDTGVITIVNNLSFRAGRTFLQWRQARDDESGGADPTVTGDIDVRDNVIISSGQNGGPTAFTFYSFAGNIHLENNIVISGPDYAGFPGSPNVEGGLTLGTTDPTTATPVTNCFSMKDNLFFLDHPTRRALALRHARTVNLLDNIVAAPGHTSIEVNGREGNVDVRNLIGKKS